MKHDLYIRELINRLARLDAVAAWQGDLNPTQRSVLEYLGRANRFSRSPSHVAEYLGSTRGTVSQSFKSLIQKSYVTEHRSASDKRAISFSLTEKGEGIVAAGNALTEVLSSYPVDQKKTVMAFLNNVLGDALAQNSGRPFGICKTCRHFDTKSEGGFCTLLSEPLSPIEATQICFEQETV
jgi:DNA-binding MarR family transcriptional regulator